MKDAVGDFGAIQTNFNETIMRTMITEHAQRLVKSRELEHCAFKEIPRYSNIMKCRVKEIEEGIFKSIPNYDENSNKSTGKMREDGLYHD